MLENESLCSNFYMNSLDPFNISYDATPHHQVLHVTENSIGPSESTCFDDIRIIIISLAGAITIIIIVLVIVLVWRFLKSRKTRLKREQLHNNVGSFYVEFGDGRKKFSVRNSGRIVPMNHSDENKTSQPNAILKQNDDT